MQTDYTFAMRLSTWPNVKRVQEALSHLKPSLSYDTLKQGCVSYQPRTPERLIALVDMLAAIDEAAPQSVAVGSARILADVVASNLGLKHLPSLSAASTGPFRLCGQVVQLVRGVLPPAASSPSPSPSPRPSPPPSPGPDRCVCKSSSDCTTTPNSSCCETCSIKDPKLTHLNQTYELL
jgi:hypothetical protein